MRKIERAGNGMEWVGGGRLRDLAYADDICLLTENLEELRRLSEALMEEAGNVGLKVNTNKTEIIKVRTEDTSENHNEEAHLKVVDKFVYSWCELQKDGDIQNDINIRIGKAGAAFRWLLKVWNKNGISLPLNKVKANQLHCYFGTSIWLRIVKMSERDRRTAKKI